MRNRERRSRGRRGWIVAAGLGLAGLGGGCAGTAEVAAPAGPLPPFEAGPAPIEPAPPTATREIGRSVEDRPIACIELGPPGRSPLLILATIHGDEPAGTPLVERLVERLRADPDLAGGRRVVVVPLVNPDGLAAGTRGNVRGVDLNRNFPARSFRETRRHGPAPLSEPESRAVAALIEAERPDLIVSVHQPLACVDYDGPADDAARRMAGATGLPLRRLGTRAGSLGAWAGEDLGVAIITLELPRGATGRAVDELWRLYGPGLLAVMAE